MKNVILENTSVYVMENGAEPFVAGAVAGTTAELFASPKNNRKEKNPEKGRNADTFHDESRLVEVRDETLLARIDGVIPGLGQAGVVGANALQATGDTLYRAIIPAGANLADSSAMEGRGKRNISWRRWNKRACKSCCSREIRNGCS